MPARYSASEPYESRDLELGSALQAWVDSNAALGELKLDGPLEAIGMDPTWVLTLQSPGLEADVRLFYGPVLDVSASRPDHIDDVAFVGGAEDFTAERLVEMLNGLSFAAVSGTLPDWLRAVEV